MSDEAPKKSGRGGRRAGAGRKKRGAVSASTLQPLDLRTALAAPAPPEVEPVAARFAALALEALYKVMIGGASDPQRVAACNEILDRGWGKPTVESGGDLMLPLFGTAPSRTMPSEIRTACRQLTELAVEVLKTIALSSASEGARVAAARSLFLRGLGAVAPARVPEDTGLRALGKKAEAVRAAENPDVTSPMGQLMARRAATLSDKQPTSH